MAVLDKVLFAGSVLGMLLILCSVVLMNLAVQRMRVVLNSSRGPENQLSWIDASQKFTQNITGPYLATYPDGPLYRHVVVGNYMFGIGLVLGIGSAVVLTFAN